MTLEENLAQFAQGRLGMFVHFGLYSLIGRGEWVLNREGMSVAEYRRLAGRFRCKAFDADAVVGLAKDAGARYVVLTTMHHDGFALYDSACNPFNSVKLGPHRDLTAETVDACRRHGLRVHLYHSLNHWTTTPDGPDALENPSARKAFVDFAHERVVELVKKFNPIECLWYDGWWPFNADQWRSQEMNDKVRSIQPHILFNGRNGLSGDFATPEQHLSAPRPWRPWEACITHNRSWGYHRGDRNWKTAAEVVDMLMQVAAGAGNLLIDIGPKGDGSVPAPSAAMLRELGRWLAVNGEAIYGSDRFDMDLRHRGDHRGDWIHNGRFTAKGNDLYIHLLNWPGREFAVMGMESQADSCELLGSGAAIRMSQEGRLLRFSGLPARAPHPIGGVLKVKCKAPPQVYNTGGLRVPTVDHPRYDPCPSDLQG